LTIWHHTRRLAAALSLALLAACGPEGEKNKGTAASVKDPKTDPAARVNFRILVQPGKKEEADLYYARIGGVLKFDFLKSSLDTLLAHLGYATPKEAGGTIVFKGLTATDLEKIPSFTLMPRNADEYEALAKSVVDPLEFRALLSLADFKNDAVLVSRFFAPKIAKYINEKDASVAVDPDDIKPGWRKLVRLTPQPGSRAAIEGKIQHAYILFNFINPDPNVDPFVGVESGNNQVIIVPKKPTEGDRVFFAVYGKGSLAKPYDIGFFLAADFDLPGHVGADGDALDREYYVPRACAECHGHSADDTKGRPVDPIEFKPTDDFATGIYRFAKPNYLDTDQWYDWKDFDFRGVSGSLNDVVFDGGRDTDSRDYARAIDVIRKLNRRIVDETLAAEADPSTPTFQTLAARKWIDLHKGSDQRKPYSVRSIGNAAWNPANVDEMKLLRLLDNHCFRCHSSLKYNVFDKQAVEDRKPIILRFIRQEVTDEQENVLPGRRMPQGRVLEEKDIAEIERLMGVVFPESPPPP
jgi:hypothetical protein